MSIFKKDKVNPIINITKTAIKSDKTKKTKDFDISKRTINCNISKRTKYFDLPKRTKDCDVSKWMEEKWNSIKDKQMHTIIIPGTHDSGSYSCDFNLGVAPFGPKIIQKKYITCCCQKTILSWTHTQKHSILKQMESGARYLDMRVCVSVIDDEIRTEHSIYGTTYKDLLKQVKTFIENTQKEFVILNFRHFGKETYYGMSPADHTNFVNMIQEELGSYLVLKEEFHNTLEDLLSANHRVFAIYNEERVAEKYENLLLGKSIWNPWTDTHTPKELIDSLEEYENTFESMKEPIFFSMQSCITPNKKMIMDFLGKKICGSFNKQKYKNTPCSLIQIAIEANNALYKWFIKQKEMGSTYSYNIISFDWIHLYNDFVLFLINFN